MRNNQALLEEEHFLSVSYVFNRDFFICLVDGSVERFKKGSYFSDKYNS